VLAVYCTRVVHDAACGVPSKKVGKWAKPGRRRSLQHQKSARFGVVVFPCPCPLLPFDRCRSVKSMCNASHAPAPLSLPTAPSLHSQPSNEASIIIIIMDHQLSAKGRKETTTAAGTGAAVVVTVAEELLVSACLCV